MSANILRANRAVLQISENFGLDCYQLKTGEYRVGFEGASIALGHAHNWLGGLPKKSVKLFKALEGAGYTGVAKTLSLPSIRGGGTTAQTLSVPDFQKLIFCEAMQSRSAQAIILLNAFSEVGINEVIRRLFSGKDNREFYACVGHYKSWVFEPGEQEEILQSNKIDRLNSRLGF